MSVIPDLPVVEEDASMLSTKFGREIANYFAGSPLNRVGFLRGDHGFLRSAFSHPSARFLLLNELAPLVDETQKSLGYVSYSDVKGFTGSDPFEKTEEDMIKNFNSEDERPLILLLGLDEANRLQAPTTGEGFSYKEWKGRPYFAVDVSPRGKLAEGANKVVDVIKARKFSFFQNQRHMGLAYGEGEPSKMALGRRQPWCCTTSRGRRRPADKLLQRLCMHRPDRCSTGTRGILSALSADPRHCLSTRALRGRAHRPTWPAGP